MNTAKNHRDNTLENKKYVMDEIDKRLRLDKNFRFREEPMALSSSDEDPYATDGDKDATFSSPSERYGASSSDSDFDNSERPKKRFKSKINLNKHKSRDISKNTETKKIGAAIHNHEPPKFVNIQRALENMNGQLIELSKSTAKLEQEIALLRDSPALSVRPAYTSENLPVNYKASGEIHFKSADKTVTVPAQNVEDALVLNEILNDKKSFEEVVSIPYAFFQPNVC